MSSHQKGERVTSATATLPPEFARHWVKRLARAMGVPQETARHWAFRRIPDARRKEIALALIAECDRLEAAIQDTRRRWEREATDEADGNKAWRIDAAAGQDAVVDRRQADRHRPVVR